MTAEWHNPVRQPSTRGRVGWLRLLLGASLSILFLALTLSRVDIGLAGAALQRVSLPLLAAALVVVLVEISIRAYRWRCLLAPIAPVSMASSFTYICIGHFANTLLPARLGDAARAHLAGRSFGASRVTVLGTILVERISDGMLIFCIVGGAVLTGSPALWPLVVGAAAAMLVAGTVVVALLLAVTRTGVAATRGGSFVRKVATRLAEGAQALRSPTRLAQVAACTGLSFVAAVAIFDLVGRSVGLGLAPWQSAVVIGSAALSTAIPAGPGSIGTYEFVGVTVMSSMGVPSEQAFVAIALVHALVTAPPALIGLFAAWRHQWSIWASPDMRSSTAA